MEQEEPGYSYPCIHVNILYVPCIQVHGQLFAGVSDFFHHLKDSVQRPGYGVYMPQYPGFFWSTTR